MGFLDDYTKAKFLGADTNSAANYAFTKAVFSSLSSSNSSSHSSQNQTQTNTSYRDDSRTTSYYTPVVEECVLETESIKLRLE